MTASYLGIGQFPGALPKTADDSRRYRTDQKASRVSKVFLYPGAKRWNIRRRLYDDATAY